MNCQQVQKLIHAHHDGELDVANTLQVDEHLADCPGCFNTARQLSALSAALRNSELRFSAPASLRQSISAAVAQAAKAERPAPVTRPWYLQPGWAVAAMLLVACVLTFQLSYPRNEDRLLAELTASHVRSLMVNHLTDVTSTDQHTVKPWFDGKIDFAPPVVDLAQQGYPLVGGRLDYLNGRSVAVMVYRYKLHPINLYVWPGNDAGATPHIYERQGYHLAHWSAAGMNYWAVTDAGDAELNGFITDLRAHSAS